MCWLHGAPAVEDGLYKSSKVHIPQRGAVHSPHQVTLGFEIQHGIACPLCLTAFEKEKCCVDLVAYPVLHDGILVLLSPDLSMLSPDLSSLVNGLTADQTSQDTVSVDVAPVGPDVHSYTEFWEPSSLWCWCGAPVK